MVANAGRDEHGVPRYSTRAFTAEEAARLRDVFGVDDPRNLYLTDAPPLGVLTYDLTRDRGWNNEVYSFHLGFVSLRRPGETWSAFKIRNRQRRDFPLSVRSADTSLADLDPSVVPLFEGLIAAARARGFDLRVIDGYRTPLREAYLMSLADGHTYTATSFHSYGRAVDFAIANCSPSTTAGRRKYIAFRRFVLAYGAGRLALIGTPDRTWDWNHVEAPAAWLGYHSIEQALDAARACTSQRTVSPCRFRSRAAGAARSSVADRSWHAP